MFGSFHQTTQRGTIWRETKMLKESSKIITRVIHIYMLYCCSMGNQLQFYSNIACLHVSFDAKIKIYQNNIFAVPIEKLIVN